MIVIANCMVLMDFHFTVTDFSKERNSAVDVSSRAPQNINLPWQKLVSLVGDFD